MRRNVQAVTAPVEGWGRAEAIAGDVGSTTPFAGRLVDRFDRRAASAVCQGEGPLSDEPVVVGSGNLELLYLPGARRLTLEDLAVGWPGPRRGHGPVGLASAATLVASSPLPCT